MFVKRWREDSGLVPATQAPVPDATNHLLDKAGALISRLERSVDDEVYVQSEMEGSLMVFKKNV